MSKKHPYNVIAIGTSAGGFQLLTYIFSNLPETFKIPILLVQHLSRESSETYIPTLNDASILPVKEGVDKEPILPGTIYVAPPDYHMLVEYDQSICIELSPPVSYSRPSVDVLFESAAESYGSSLIGIILSGANTDGAKGLAKVKHHGGHTIIQDPLTSDFKRMPQAAYKATKVDQVLSIDAILEFLLSL